MVFCGGYECCYGYGVVVMLRWIWRCSGPVGLRLSMRCTQLWGREKSKDIIGHLNQVLGGQTILRYVVVQYEQINILEYKKDKKERNKISWLNSKLTHGYEMRYIRMLLGLYRVYAPTQSLKD